MERLKTYHYNILVVWRAYPPEISTTFWFLVLRKRLQSVVVIQNLKKQQNVSVHMYTKHMHVYKAKALHHIKIRILKENLFHIYELHLKQRAGFTVWMLFIHITIHETKKEFSNFFHFTLSFTNQAYIINVTNYTWNR